jgi:thiol-disulfide isomerase/thioredoxin
MKTTTAHSRLARATAPARARTLVPVLALVFALGADAVLPAVASAQDEGIAVGETPDAPTLETLDGETMDLGGVFGTKPVLLEFWATWCAICRALEPRVHLAHEAYGDRVAFLVVAVGVAQTPDQVRRHLDRRPMPGTILWDGRGAAARAFQAPGTGFIVILDRNGRVAYTGTGADQDLVAALRSVVDGPGG